MARKNDGIIISDDTTGLIAAPERSRSRRLLATAGWIALALFFLILFTLFKLPEARLKNFIHGSLNSALSAQGITLSAADTSVSTGLGISYTMKDVTISFPPPQPPVRVDRIDLSPSFGSLILGKIGGELYVEAGSGSLSGTFSVTDAQKPDLSVSLKAKRLDLGKLGVLPALTQMRGSAVVSGSASLAGDLGQPNTWNGQVDLDLSKIAFDQQSLMGFSIPRISVSEGEIEISFEKGKALVRKLKLGKPGSKDDIVASVAGDVQLGRQLPASTLNLKTKFSFSKSFTDAFPSFSLLEGFLKPGKQADGSYGFNLSGPLYGPRPTPAGS